MMHYHQLPSMGAPMATGVIEGACRHVVTDRMDRTGARWRLLSAEAVLRIRPPHSGPRARRPTAQSLQAAVLAPSTEKSRTHWNLCSRTISETCTSNGEPILKN